MNTQHHNIDFYLGTPDIRYFGEGFRAYYFDLYPLSTSDREINGLIRSSYLGGSRPRNEAPHLGSIEFLALAMRLATHGLNRLGKLGIEDTNRAFMSHYSLRTKQVLQITTLPFYCRMQHSGPHIESLQGSRSLFDIRIGGNSMLLELDHRGGARFGSLPRRQTLSYEQPQLHCSGYKQTGLSIDQIEVDTANLWISAIVQHSIPVVGPIYNGVGSATLSMLGTDATRVFGQLTQALLYTAEGTDRIRCPNIWLRKMELRTTRPVQDTTVQAKVQFQRIREVQHQGHRWKLIELSGTVGCYFGTFEVGIMR